MKTTLRRAGKAIGGGKLTHIVRGGRVIGSINELSVTGLFILQMGSTRENPFTVHETMADACAAVGV